MLPCWAFLCICAAVNFEVFDRGWDALFARATAVTCGGVPAIDFPCRCPPERYFRIGVSQCSHSCKDIFFRSA